MRGVEGAPLMYIIAAIAVVIALSILVLMGGTVKKGVSSATQTLNKSIVEGSKRLAQEVGGTLYENDEPVIYLAKNGTIKWYIYNWKDTNKIKIYINGSDVEVSPGDVCKSMDADGDGKIDDLECNYNASCSSVKVETYKDGELLGYHQLICEK